MILLENVDRLLKSPTDQRGRDFAVMLGALSNLDYNIEWRVITASDYGMPQRRKRIFVFGVQKSTKIGQEMESAIHPIDWLSRKGVFARAFPIKKIPVQMSFDPASPYQQLHDSNPLNLHAISESFNLEKKKSPFENSVW